MTTPFPTSVGTTPNPLSSVWLSAMTYAGLVKTETQNIKTASLNGSIGASYIKLYLTRLADYKLKLAACAAVTGIGPYAQGQVNDATLDVAAAYSALTAAMDATRDWVMTNFPKDPSNYLLAEQFDANGRTVDRQFTTASLAAFRTQLDSLLATLN